MNDFYRDVLEYHPGAIVLCDDFDRIILVNRFVCTLFGYDKEEFSEISLSDIIIYNLENASSLGRGSKIPGEIIRSTLTCRKKSGFLFPCEICVSNMNNENGRIFIILIQPLSDESESFVNKVNKQDISISKEVETSINNSERYFRTLLDIAPFGILVSQNDGVTEYFSTKVSEMFRIPDYKRNNELLIFDFISMEYREDFERRFRESISGITNRKKGEYKGLRYDGSEFWAEFNFSPLKDASGKTTRIMLVFQDITSRKDVEEELRSARERAEQSDRLKVAILHNISHEIRTPLNSILGFSDLIADSEVTPESRSRYSEIIHSSSDQLLSTINDLISISSIQAGSIKIDKVEVGISEVMREICNKFKIKAEEGNIRIDLVEPEDRTTIMVLTDKKKLIQIISNLLKNAIKFSFKKDIETGYLLKGQYIEFYVSDKGIGISPEYHSRIFEPFFQVECPEEIRVEGTGMGLALCRSYVELLGGRIWLNSLPGEGSVFYFTIPV